MQFSSYSSLVNITIVCFLIWFSFIIFPQAFVPPLACEFCKGMSYSCESLDICCNIGYDLESNNVSYHHYSKKYQSVIYVPFDFHIESLLLICKIEFSIKMLWYWMCFFLLLNFQVKSKGHILAVVDENGFIVIYNTKKTGQMAIQDGMHFFSFLKKRFW